MFKMADKMRFVVMIMALFVSTSFGQTPIPHMDTSVCVGLDPGPNDPAMPAIPQSFDCHMEANINNKKFTTDFHIYFDKPNNRVALYLTTAGYREQRIYNFATRQFLKINRDTNVCTVMPLNSKSNVPLYFLFGNAQAQMLNSSQFIHFNDGTVRYKWINQTLVRGIRCNMWRTCLFLPTMGSTMNIDWYFSANTWLTSTLNPQVPVRAHVYGKTKGRAFDHIYEFSDFHLNYTGKGSSPYMSPPGAYCFGESSKKPLPNPASAFHFTAEIVQSGIQSVNSIKEYYNNDLKLVRYDYIPSDPTLYGSNMLTEVHDFSTGVAYITDTLRGNCSIVKIENTGFDVRNADPLHVRIRSSKEFFYFDKASYIYEGQRVVRGITTDVWIAQRSDWPNPSAHINSTWEWYFATPKYTETLPDKLQFQNPVMLSMSAGLGQQYYYNIYAYDERRPVIWSYDISKCFNYTQRRDFSFKLPGSYQNLAQANLERFRYAILQSITKAGSFGGLTLSALRIYNIQLDYSDNTDITVTFTLLDKAPAIGDITNPSRENGLTAVATAISVAISRGQFSVRIRSPITGQPVTMVAKANPLVQTQRIVKRSYYRQTVQGPTTSTGTSGGAMAGMGVALLVVFFIIGVLGTYFYYRKQGGAFGPKKFNDEDITESTS